jgi:hypothetical protein
MHIALFQLNEFAMRDKLDPEIERLFMQEHVLPYSEELMSITRERLHRARRAMSRSKLLGAIATALVAAGASPWIAYGAASLVTLVQQLMQGVLPLLLAPYGSILEMTFTASFVVSCPLIYLWRSRQW